MAVRGPDDRGIWLDAERRIGLAHRRLAIVDPSPAGAQPMVLGDERLAISFNGEIYNFRELRRTLEAAGRRFRTESDTEVVLHLYDRDGPGMVERLRGMFALAIWDAGRRGLLLARDGFGIKPLYYADSAGTLRFASQVKALLAGGGVDAAPSPAGRAGFFVWGYVPEPWTLFEGIRCLPAGSTMWVDGRGARPPACWFDVGAELARAAEAPAAWTREALRDAVSDTVRHHLVADVPVGGFLSAGLDSATVVAHAAHLASGALRSLTLVFDAFEGGRFDETRDAARVAARYETVHRTERVARHDFPGRVRPAAARHGSAVRRRRQHVLRQQGGGRERTEGGPVGRWGRRAVRRLRRFLADTPTRRFAGPVRRPAAGRVPLPAAGRAPRRRAGLAQVRLAAGVTAAAGRTPTSCAGRCSCPGSCPR